MTKQERNTMFSEVTHSKGKNIHIIGAISKTGLLYWERRRGSYRKEDCYEWWLRASMETENPQNICVVCDNAPYHVSLVDVSIQEEGFAGGKSTEIWSIQCTTEPHRRMLERCQKVASNREHFIAQFFIII